MTLKKINPTKTKSWKKLKTHFKEIENEEIKNLLSSRDQSLKFSQKVLRIGGVEKRSAF